jgi:hypothetical protein
MIFQCQGGRYARLLVAPTPLPLAADVSGK